MICTTAEITTILGLDAGDPRERVVALVHKAAERLVKKEVGANLEQGTFTEYLPAQGPSPEPADLVANGQRGVAYYQQRPALQLRHTPVRVIVSVNETIVAGGGGWPPESLLPASAYWLDESEPGLSRSGLLYRSFGSSVAGFYVGRGGSWPALPRSVRVVYVGGWTPQELDDECSDIKQAVRLAVGTKWRELETLYDQASGSPGIGPLASESIMGWSQSFDMESVRQQIGMWSALPAGVRDMLQHYKNYGRLLG
jgi:hypothetical protein